MQSKRQPIRSGLISIFLFLTAIFYSHSVVALGLDNIKVNSSLNEPLSATIRILKNRSENEIRTADISVGLADRELHLNAGIILEEIAKDLRFTIVADSSDELIINVYTVRTVYEPLLNFLVDLRWPDGRLVKEYSLILDPASFSSQPSVRPQSDNSAFTAPPVIPDSSSVIRPSRSPVTLSGDNYTVRSGDSLSKIALAVRNRDGGDLEQIMEAIYATNPDAFLGSPNQLMADVPLFIPTDIGNTITSIAYQEPYAETVTPVERTTPTYQEQPSEQAQARLEIVPPDDNVISTTTAIVEDTQASTPSISASERNALADSVAELEKKLELLAEQNALLIERNELFEKQLQAASGQQPRVIEVSGNQVPASNQTTSNFLKYFPWLAAALLSLALLLQFFNKNRTGVVRNDFTKPYRQPVPNQQRLVADLDEYDAVQAEPTATATPYEDTSTPKEVETQQLLVDDLTKSQEVYSPTAIIDADSDATQTYMGSLEDVELDAGQNLDAAQEAEIYLAYQQFKLADKTITRLLDVDPDNYKFQILKLQLLAKTGKMEDLQELSVELLSRFPNRDDEIHQRIQDICDMAFSSNLGTQIDPPKNAQNPDLATNPMPEYEETKESDSSVTLPSLAGAVSQEDITEFLNEDLTLSDTDPMLVSAFTDAEPDTEILETGKDYTDVSDQLTELMDDITEEGLDLPFDLETELMQEEQKQRLIEEQQGTDADSADPESDDQDPEVDDDQ